MKRVADIAWSRQLAGTSVSLIALWAFAGAMMVAAHGAAGWWIMQERAEPVAQLAAPAAIMIELAPEPVAPAATEEQIAPDDIDSQAVEETPFEPVEEKIETEEIVEPVEEVAEELPEPVDPVEQLVAALNPVELPVPQARPEPPRKKPEPKKAKQQPSPEKRRAQVKTQQEAPRTAAPQNSSGASSSVSPARWQARVHSHIAKRQRRNVVRKAGESGVSQVRFSIDGNGNVLSASLARSSGNSILDDEAVSMVRRASPIPAPPPGVNSTIVLPIHFNIR